MITEVFEEILRREKLMDWRRFLLGCCASFVLWRVASLLMLYHLRLMNIHVEGKTLVFEKWLSELDFILKGADRIVEKSEKLRKSIFAIPALSCYQILIADRDRVMEFTKAGEDVMSFRAAMNERLFFKYTMFGFELNNVDPHDEIPRRVAKIYLRENMHALEPILKARVEEVFARVDRIGDMNTIKVSAFDISKSLVARMNNQLLFGDELAGSEEFEKESIRYAWHTIILMQLLRQLPSLIVPLVAKLFMAWSGSMNRVGDQVRKLVMDRLENRNQGSKNAYIDGIEWVISSSVTPAQQDPKRIVQQMVALLFASMHQMQMATTWAMIDLCTYKEFIEPLRAEIRSVFENNHKDPYNKLYLMDSFLRESSRMYPLAGLTVQRKALKPFTFSDGSHVPAGNLVAVPQRVVMQDPARYSNPQKFDPLRYMKSTIDPGAATTKYADVNWNYTFWGSPRKSCPGRWYASYALKHILVHLLMNYDLELVGSDTPKYFIWTTAIVPRSDIHISLKRRYEGLLHGA